jgi:hypothetical protein
VHCCLLKGLGQQYLDVLRNSCGLQAIICTYGNLSWLKECYPPSQCVSAAFEGIIVLLDGPSLLLGVYASL